MRRPFAIYAAALAAVTTSSAAQAASLSYFTSSTTPIGGQNAEFDADGVLPQLSADFTLDTRNANTDFTSGTVSVGYEVTGSGFDDLTGIPGATHLVHLHSQFEENIGKGTDLPGIVSQLNGDFFTGDPGNAIAPLEIEGDSAALLGAPGYLDVFEEVPEEGPVTFYLGRTGIEAPEDGVAPLDNLLNKISSGEIDPKEYLPDTSEFNYSNTRIFDLADADERRLILNVIGENGDEFGDRTMDAHGFSVSKEISDALDTAVFGMADPDLSQATVNGFSTLLAGVPLFDGTEYRLTAPAVTDGDLVPAPVPLPAGLPLLLAGIGGLGIFSVRRKDAK